MTIAEMGPSNPFPAYAVMRLLDDDADIRRATVPTAPIAAVDECVEAYTKSWSSDSDPVPLIIQVKGDYGSGKTHLVRYAGAVLEEDLREVGVGVRTVAVATTEVHCMDWYRSVLGPALRGIDPEDLVHRIVAKAAIRVADQAKLTKDYGEKLAQDHMAVFGMLQKDRLSYTDVHQVFRGMLEEICGDAPEGKPVRLALEALAWQESSAAALTWLTGASLNRSESERLRIPEKLGTEDEATEVLAALAAVCEFLRLPLMLIVDEFEHLARFDVAESRQNATWLKRLFERLEDHRTVLFLAGHWSAWEQQEDFGDRFSKVPEIGLLKLGPEDIEAIVEARVDGPHEFEMQHASAVAAATRGRMRQVISLLSALYRETDGLTSGLSVEKIQAVAEGIGVGISIPDVKLRLRGMFEDGELSVVEGADSSTGVPFTLSGYSQDVLRVGAKVEHVPVETQYHEVVHRFEEQMQRAREVHADAIGILLASGNVDDDYLDSLRSLRHDGLLFFDLRQQNVFSDVAQALTARLSGSPGQDAHSSDAELEGAEADDRRRRIERFRHAERERLERRVEEAAAAAGDDRAAHAVTSAPNEANSRLYLTYQELSQPPGVMRRLRFLNWRVLFLVAVFGVIAMAGLIVPAYVISDLSTGSELVGIVGRITMIAIGLIAAISSLWSGLVAVDRYFGFASRQLRELYVREASEAQLVRASYILERAIETMPPSRARRRSELALADEFPQLQYLRDE